MLRIAIKEQNSHFEHGLKIIMTRLANQWQQKIDFLPPEEIDNADIAFLPWMMIGSALAVIRYLCIPNISYGRLFVINAIKKSSCSDHVCICCRIFIGKMMLKKLPGK